MKIVMLEPLGVKEQVLNTIFKPLVDKGHEFVFCGTPIPTEEEKIALAKDADVLVIANSPLTANVINAAENLKFVSVGFTGVDHVDLQACKARGVVVSNSQGYATYSTAECTVALMLACLRNIVPHDKGSREGGTLKGYKHNTLKGKTIGIIGTGAIGRHVAKLTKAFGVELIGYDVTEYPQAKEIGIQYKSIEDVVSTADIITVHVPLMPTTKHLINKELISKMKKDAIFINCARGPLVDSDALAAALNEGRISRAGIDVLEMEPPFPADHPLLNAKNTIVMPHIGFFSEESLEARAHIVFDNVVAWEKGSPINVKA